MSNKYRKLLLSATCLVSLLSIACPFKTGNSELRPIGPTVEADLLIYLNSGLSHEQINDFSKNILSRPDPEGRGHRNPPGVRTLLRIPTVEEHQGIAITFFPNATKEQREELMRSIKASPLVYRVLENTAPDSVKTLKMTNSTQAPQKY